MPHLSDQHAAYLLEEIAASMQGGIPPNASMRRLQEARLGRVAIAAATIADQLEQGIPLADSLEGAFDVPIPGVRTAVEVAVRDNDPTLLRRMSRLLLRRSEVQREIRFAWFYPVCLLLAGYLVATFVMVPLVMNTADTGFRQQQSQIIQWPDAVYQTATWFADGGWILLAGLLITICIGWILLGRGRKFPSATRKEIFCQSMADQISSNVPESDAIIAAAKIADESELAMITNPCLTNAAVARILDPPFAQELPTDFNERNQEALVEKMRYLATAYHEQGRQRTQLWSRIVPRTATVMFGASLILGYAWWVIGPVYKGIGSW